MTKITLIGIDTAKQVFHLVGVDANGKEALIDQSTPPRRGI